MTAGFYDAIADVCTAATGTGALHKGYFDGPDDPAQLKEGADRLTRLAGARLGLGPGTSLLDIGCGTGQPAVLLAEETGCAVTGVDIGERQVDSAVSLAAGRTLRRPAAFHRADATALPLSAGSFDRALMMEVTTHLPDTADGGKRAALAEAARCLVPGGLLLVSDLVRRVAAPAPDGLAAVPSVHLATAERLVELLDTAGFDVLRIEDLGERVRPTGRKAEQAVELRRQPITDVFGASAFDEMTTLVRRLAQAERDVGYVMVTARSRAPTSGPASGPA